MIHAYGTNTGIEAVASGGHGHTEDGLSSVRRRYLSAEAARAIAIQITNAAFAARNTGLWGQGSAGVASASAHVRACDRNAVKISIWCGATRLAPGCRDADRLRPEDR